MKRHRKRPKTFYAMVLSTVLAIGLIAPAAAGAVSEGALEEDEVGGIDEEADECVLYVDLEGDQLHKELYERPGLQYKKQVKTYRTEYTYDKEKWVPGVKQYKYEKQSKTREWVEGQDEVLEYKWQKMERTATPVNTYKRWKVQKRVHPNGSVASPHGDAYWIAANRVVGTDPLTINPLGTHHEARVVDVSRFNVLGSGNYGPNTPTGTYIYRQVGSETETATAPPAGDSWKLIAEDVGEPVYGEWTEVGDIVTTPENVAPGEDTLTEKWVAKGTNVVTEATPGSWGPFGPWAPYGSETGWFDGPRTTLNGIPGAPWTVGVAKFLGHDFSTMYKYVQSATQWKPGTNQWVPFKQDLGPSATKPSTAPFWVGGTLYKYTNIQEHQVFDGWKWFKLDDDYVYSDWLKLGQKIDTGLGFSVWPGHMFKHGDTWYRYRAQPANVRSPLKWVTEDVAGEGTTPPPGEDWEGPIASWVVDPEPNQVRVTINGEIVEEATFGETYTESFLLDHDDEYLVEYKLHGDEDWSTDQEGVADCNMPDADVEFSEWEDGALECDSENVELTRTKTTTPFIWDSETRTWVEDLENVVEETETDTRELTAEEEAWQESSECVEVLDEVEEKPEEEPEVEDEAEEEPEVESVAVKKTVETKVLASTLPKTGASVIALLVAGLLALFAGGGALSVRRRNER